MGVVPLTGGSVGHSDAVTARTHTAPLPRRFGHVTSVDRHAREPATGGGGELMGGGSEGGGGEGNEGEGGGGVGGGGVDSGGVGGGEGGGGIGGRGSGAAPGE